MATTHNLKGAKGYPMIDSMPAELPSFSLTVKQLPELKNWSVGHKYTLEIEVEQLSLAKDEYMPNEPMRARFRITKIKDTSESADVTKAKKGYE